MADDATKPVIDDDQEALRARVREVMEAGPATMADISRASGIAYGTFSNWMNGTYGGRTARVAEQVRRWLATREQAARTHGMVPAAPAFVLTPTAEHFLAALEHAQHLAEMVVITGAPGVGKTSACHAFRARSVNVHLVTGEPTMTSPRALLDEIADALGAASRGMSSLQLSRGLVRRLRGTGALLIVDEAQHLPSQVLDQLRTIHDLAGIGVALTGNATVFGRLEGGTRAAHYAQLYSRIGMRVSRNRPTRKDVDALLDAWQLADKGARALAHAVAGKPGALRNVSKVLRVAHMTAAAGAEAVDERHVRLAWETLGAREPAVAA